MESEAPTIANTDLRPLGESRAAAACGNLDFMEFEVVVRSGLKMLIKDQEISKWWVLNLRLDPSPRLGSNPIILFGARRPDSSTLQSSRLE